MRIHEIYMVIFNVILDFTTMISTYLLTRSENGKNDLLTRAVRNGSHTTNHLVGLTRIKAKNQGEL